MTPPSNRLRVLCVDDEPKVLEGLTLHLRRCYDIITATSGNAGLELLSRQADVAVVLSDMKMPGMNGATFLAQARRVAPDATRVLLTGQSDLESAIAAVNEGQIFRFLVKPCPPPVLLVAVEEAAKQHRLVTAERVLLEQTLHGSIKAMMEVLALTNPISFGSANRIKQLVTEIGIRLKMDNLWQVEMAALLRQLGFISLPPETVEKYYYGQLLSHDEEQMIAKVPGVTEQLLANIPRLETMREILTACEKPSRYAGSSSDSLKYSIFQAGQLLRLAVDFDALVSRGVAEDLALATLRSREGTYTADLLQALFDLRGACDAIDEIRELPLADLRLGMILAEDMKSPNGLLLAAKGYQITNSFLERARNFAPGTVKEPLRVSVGTKARP